jgi:hypothetical protein
VGSPIFSITPPEENEVISEIENNEVTSELSDEEMRKVHGRSRAVGVVRDRFTDAKTFRNPYENRWLKNYALFKGQLSSEEKAKLQKVLSRNPTASDVFIKITKTKTLAAFGQLEDILFADKRFPIGVEPTPIPDGVADSAYIAPEAVEQQAAEESPYGYPGDGKQIEPGATKKSLLGGLFDKYSKFLKGKTVVEGISPDPKTMPQLHPAQESADRMDKTIQDQLSEGKIDVELRKALIELTMLGSMVVKGPFSHYDTISKWERDKATGINNYNPIKKLVPLSKWVSVWNFYPKPGLSRTDELPWCIERHNLYPHELRKLKHQPNFDADAINRVLETPNIRSKEFWESALQDYNLPTFTDDQYEVLEYWGYLDKEILESLGDVAKDELEKYVEFAQVQMWVCGNELLKLVLNPFVPARIPYYMTPYEENLYVPWGTGIPENMEDTQEVMNSHMRMGIDNLKFAGSIMFEVNESQLVPGQDTSIYPGKVWRKQGGAPGQSIFGFTTPNTAPAHLQMFDKARQLADESTGLFSNSYGSSGAQGQPRTAAGMSMLMSAAGINIKTVIKNIDKYLLEPLGEAYFNWNMQFGEDMEIKGDLKVVSRGTTTLMQREVQSQRLLSFLQVGSNPLLAPFLNVEYIIKQIAKSMDLDPDKAVNDPTTAMLFAELMGKVNGTGQNPGAETPPTEQPQGQGGAEAAPPGANPEDTTGAGGGNIGVGSAPQPGQAGFAG